LKAFCLRCVYGIVQKFFLVVGEAHIASVVYFNRDADGSLRESGLLLLYAVIVFILIIVVFA
jgi:hypothetical protein